MIKYLHQMYFHKFGMSAVQKLWAELFLRVDYL